MKQRIQKILSDREVASRRQAEKLILEGRVCCNGTVCVTGQSADPDVDLITVDGLPIPAVAEKLYLMLNKPKGYVTTLSDDRGRKTVAQLVAQCPQRVYPVGRLDMDSEGLLILTNDGAFANKLMHPRHQVQKTYRVEVTGLTEQGLKALERPIVLDGYKIAPPEISLVSREADKGVILVTIHEGRNRQVRRMCARAGMSVKRLIRIREGGLCLGQLSSGSWRYLTQKEVEAIINE